MSGVPCDQSGACGVTSSVCGVHQGLSCCPATITVTTRRPHRVRWPSAAGSALPRDTCAATKSMSPFLQVATCQRRLWRAGFGAPRHDTRILMATLPAAACGCYLHAEDWLVQCISALHARKMWQQLRSTEGDYTEVLDVVCTFASFCKRHEFDDPA